MMSITEVAYLFFFMLGSVCFFVGTLILWIGEKI